MTADQIARLMKRRRDKLQPALEATTKTVAVVALKNSKARLNKIYQIPEDLTAKGAKRIARVKSRQRFPGAPIPFRKGDRKWVRTGHLQRSEHVTVEGATRIVLGNTAIYGKARHDAVAKTTPGKREPKPPKGEPRRINPARVNHWEADASKELHELATAAWRETVRDVLAGRL